MKEDIKMSKPIVWAHRGASAYAPQNTLEAFELAREMGAYGVENDVHMTKDGKIVVCHNDTIEGTSDGKGNIHDMTYEELLQYDFSANFKGKYDHKVRIPLLTEVYDILRPAGMWLNCEIKDCRPEAVDEIIRLHRASGMADHIMYSCFNHGVFARMREQMPELIDGLLYGDELPEGRQAGEYAESLHAKAVHPHFAVFSKYPDYADECHAHGIKINAWTIDGEEDIRFAIEHGTDGIITDCPDLALRLVNENA